MRQEYIDAGEIVTTHGVRGEVKVLPWLDSAEDLRAYSRCIIHGKEYQISACRIQKNCCLIKLQGVDTMDDAQALRGETVRIFRSDAPEGIIFAAEMIGVRVWTDNICIGEVQEVLDYPGNLVYVVRGEYEYSIPAVKEFVLNVDTEENRMDVRLLEGMRTDEG